MLKVLILVHVYFNGNLQFNQLNTLSSQGIKTDYIGNIIDQLIKTY